MLSQIRNNRATTKSKYLTKNRHTKEIWQKSAVRYKQLKKQWWKTLGFVKLKNAISNENTGTQHKKSMVKWKHLKSSDEQEFCKLGARTFLFLKYKKHFNIFFFFFFFFFHFSSSESSIFSNIKNFLGFHFSKI